MLNIKDPRAHKLAVEVAARHGESLTEAVIHALEERLDRAPSADGPGRELDIPAIMKTIEELRAALPPEFFEEEDPSAFLYDPETGLPV